MTILGPSTTHVSVLTRVRQIDIIFHPPPLAILRDPVTAPEATTAEQALDMIKKQRIDNVCLVNAAGELKALAAREWFKDAR